MWGLAPRDYSLATHIYERARAAALSSAEHFLNWCTKVRIIMHAHAVDADLICRVELQIRETGMRRLLALPAHAQRPICYVSISLAPEVGGPNFRSEV